MSAIGLDVPIRTTITPPYRPFRDPEIPTVVGNPADSIGWFVAKVELESVPSRTTVLQGSLGRRAGAPTEPDRYPVQPLEPSEEDKLHAKLLSYLELQPDWDGRGSVPTSLDAVLDAIAFLGRRPPDVPLPFPQIASDGEVGLYWRTGEVHIEIGFYGDGEASYYARYTPAAGDSDECGRDGYSLKAGSWPRDLMLILDKLQP